MTSPSDFPQMRYGLNEWPPFKATILLGLQWLFVLLPGLLGLCAVAAQAEGLDQISGIKYISRMLLVAGLAQGVQVLWGHRLPGLVGPTAALLAVMVASMSHGADAVYGSMLAGAILVVILGVLGLVRRLARLFTPLVLGLVLLLISISLIPPTIPLLLPPAGEDGGIAGFWLGLALPLIMFLLQSKTKGLWSSCSLLLGMLAGTVIYYALGLGPWPVLTETPAAALSLNDLLPRSLSFDLSLCLVFCLAYLTVGANELASVEAIAPLAQAQNVESRASRGVVVTGFSGVLSALLGVPGMVTYSVSPGILLASRNASRFTLLPAALILLVLGFFPSLSGVFAWIPRPVMGGVLLSVTVGMAQAGFYFFKAEMEGGDINRTGLIVGFCLMASLICTFAPYKAFALWPDGLKMLVSNGFIVGLALALLLEHVLMRKPKSPKPEI